jgi:hypothetical protein
LSELAESLAQQRGRLDIPVNMKKNKVTAMEPESLVPVHKPDLAGLVNPLAICAVSKNSISLHPIWPLAGRFLQSLERLYKGN